MEKRLDVLEYSFRARVFFDQVEEVYADAASQSTEI